MRVPLANGLGILELIDQSEPDWRYTAVCENAGEVAKLAFWDDRSPDAARVRGLVASTLAASPGLLSGAASGLLGALEAALRCGSIRLTSGRTAVLQKLAPYKPPAKPVQARPAAARVVRQGAAAPTTPEETTDADAECLKEASRQGAAFVA